MKLHLLQHSEAPNEGAGAKTCGKGSGEYATDQLDGSTDNLQPSGDLKVINRFCRKLLYKHGKVDDKNVSSKLLEHGNVDFNELITYWMLEGYLGLVDSVEEAYEKGHEIFIDMAYEERPTPEAFEEEMFNSFYSESLYLRYRGFYGATKLGLVDAFDQGKMPKLGELVLDSGVIRTLKHTDDKQWSCSCLLLDGNQLDRQVLKYFSDGLEYFAYFNPRPSLPWVKAADFKLTMLVLRGCALLEGIDASIGEMSNLTTLEISGPSSIRIIPESLFTKLTKLQSLNLSHLQIEALPKKGFSKLVHLRWLILRGCCRLTDLPSTKDMSKLEVIDLYGAKSFKKLSTTKLVKHQIQMLDLSHTRITRVPCLISPSESSSTKITHLFLRNCEDICVFQSVEKMDSLKVLDLSGAKRLKQIDTLESHGLVVLDLSRTGLKSLPEALQNLKKLHDLNLSETDISSIPPLSNLSSLHRLIVRDCPSLKGLPEMKELVNLEVLDISGCTSLENVEQIPFQKLSSLVRLYLSNTNIGKLATSQDASSSEHHLQLLDLSKTCVKELPDMSHLKSLKQLLLAGCSQLKLAPDLTKLTQLEVLELSETEVGNEVLDKVPTSLRRLLLKGCSKINGPLPKLESLKLLQELDLRGSSVTEFPYEIAEKSQLRCLRLPDKIAITEVDRKRISRLPEEIIWDQQINILESSNILTSSGKKDFVSFGGNEIYSTSVRKHSMSAESASNTHVFHLEDNQHQWEAYFKQFNFSVSPSRKVDEAQPEIYFDGDELVFKGNHHSPVKFPNIKPQDQSVEIHGFSSTSEVPKIALEKAVNVALVGNSFFVSLSDECFQSMKSMKVCWIRSCTEMKFVLQGENQSDGILKCLETLVLSNLVNLMAVYADNVLSQCIIESLKHMYIDCCPVLNMVFKESHLHKNLETLHIRFCDALKDVCSGNASSSTLPKLSRLSLLQLPDLQSIGTGLPSLETLVISQCPKFVRVLSSSMLPEKLQVLEIRSCEGLTTLFESAESASSSSSSRSPPSLPSLLHLTLWNLPKLKSIDGDFPRLQTCQIELCPLLPRHLWPQPKTISEESR